MAPDYQTSYHAQVNHYESLYHQRALYPFDSVESDHVHSKSEYQDSFIKLENGILKFHQSHAKNADIFIEIAAHLSFISAEYRNQAFVQDLIIGKVFSKHLNNTTVRYWYRKKSREFGMKLEQYTQFNFEFFTFFSYFSLSDLLFDFLPRSPLHEPDFFHRLYDYILEKFVPDETVEQLNEKMEYHTLEEDLVKLFENPHNSEFEQIKAKKQAFFPRVNYSKMNLQVGLVMLEFNNPLPVSIHQLLSQFPFFQLGNVFKNVFFGFIILPPAIHQQFREICYNWKKYQFISDFFYGIKDKHDVYLIMDKIISQTKKVHSFFPFQSPKLKRKIDKRKIPNVIADASIIHYQEDCALAKDPISILEMLGMVFSDTLTDWFGFDTFNQALVNSRTKIQENLSEISELFINSVITQTPQKLQEKITVLTQACDQITNDQLTEAFHRNFQKKRLSIVRPYEFALNYIFSPFNTSMIYISKIQSGVTSHDHFPQWLEEILGYFDKSHYHLLPSMHSLAGADSKKDTFGINFIIDINYTDFFLKFLAPNGQILRFYNNIFTEPQSKYFLLTHYDFSAQKWNYEWLTADLKKMAARLKKTLPQPQSSSVKFELTDRSGAIASRMSRKMPSLTEIFETLDHLNQYNVFRHSPSFNSPSFNRKLTGILTRIFQQDYLNLTYPHENFINRLKTLVAKSALTQTNQEKLLQLFLPHDLPARSFEHFSQILVVLDLHSLDITLNDLKTDPFWRGLYCFGLVHYYLNETLADGLHIFHYVIPTEILLNKKSDFTRLLKRMHDLAPHHVLIYEIEQTVSMINNNTIFPTNSYDASGKVFTLSPVMEPVQWKTVQRNPLVSIQRHYTSSPITPEFLFAIGYGMTIGVLVKDLPFYPTNLIKFAEHHPFTRLYTLQRLYPGTSNKNDETQTSKAIFGIFSMNRNARTYIQQIEREFQAVYSPDQYLITTTMKYPLVYPDSSLTALIKASRRAERMEQYYIPLFEYRHRTRCFPLNLRLEIFREFPQEQIPQSKLQELRKLLSKLSGDGVEERKQVIHKVFAH